MAVSVLVGAAVVVVAVCLFGGSEGPRLTRRAWARLSLFALGGLAWGARAPADEAESGEGETLVRKWAWLGRLWRRMTAHLKDDELSGEEGAKGFARLRELMQQALAALPAWPQLQAVFTNRWGDIERSRYSRATCYMPAPPGDIPIPRPEAAISSQVEELGRLVAEGKLTKEAGDKAAQVLAVQAEYLVKEGRIPYNDADARRSALRALWKQYDDGSLQASPPAALAGKRLVELTVDKLGWLAGPPQENEGTDKAAQ